jgi:hypothetical protein
LAVVHIEIPDYDSASGLRLPVVSGGVIEASKRGSELLIRANGNGLRLMAGQLLALAQPGVPDGTHIHYDPPMLEDGSDAFVVERFGPDI